MTLVSPPSVALTAKNTYDKQSLIDTINASSAASNNGRWNIKGSSSRPRPISSQGQPPSSYLFCITPATEQKPAQTRRHSHCSPSWPCQFQQALGVAGPSSSAHGRPRPLSPLFC